MALVLAGIGWLLAYTPSVWKLVVYSILAFTFMLLIACVRKFLRKGS
jgi:hypothetical protein